MKGVNSSPEDGGRNGRIGPETEPQIGPGTLNIKVSHGVNDHEVAVPSNSTFGDLKSIIVQKIGLNPETHKLLFRGKEKEDDEDLQTSGVKDNAKVLLIEDITCGQKNTEKVKETNVISQGGEAVAQVREEVDKFANQVSALRSLVDSGTKVDNKDIVYLTEMLMRQLLKLDGIEAEGEGKVQRKMEVRRVQSLVETMDLIKSRNSNPFINGDKNASVTTQWETFEPGSGSVSSTSSPVPSSLPIYTPTPTPTPTPLSPHAPSHTPTTPTPTPTPLPPHAPSHNPTIPTPTPFPPHAPSHTPTPFPPHAPSHTPNLTSFSPNAPSYTPNPTPFPPYAPSHTPNPIPFSPLAPSHTPNPYPFPPHAPSHTPNPYPFPPHAPYHTPNPYPFPPHAPSHILTTPTPTPTLSHMPMPSSTKVTQDWEHFD